jgi:hypothetical protein
VSLKFRIVSVCASSVRVSALRISLNIASVRVEGFARPLPAAHRELASWHDDCWSEECCCSVLGLGSVSVSWFGEGVRPCGRSDTQAPLGACIWGEVLPGKNADVGAKFPVVERGSEFLLQYLASQYIHKLFPYV